MATKNTPIVQSFSIRGGARYLQDNGVDIGEMRLRTLLRQHEIFVQDPDTTKSKQGDSELELWKISQTALDKYIDAAKKGTIRTTSGAKAYRVNLTADQLAELRTWTSERGIAEPVRANKAYQAKGKLSADGVGEGLEGSMAGLDPNADDYANELFEAEA